MLLVEKNAVIYGGGGAIGSAVAHAFAREGANVFLAGRTMKTLEDVAKDIRSAGGNVEAAKLDALDERAVDDHFAGLVATAGHIDISLNVISVGDIQGIALADMTLEDFERPVATAVRTQFLTTRAAARHMRKRKSGVILTFGGCNRDPIRNYFIGGFQVSLGAVDVLRKQLASELGQFGVRVITLESGGVVETLPRDFEGRDDIIDMVVGETMLNRAATFEDIGNAAVFAASDMARSMTGAVLNLTCGAIVD